MPPAQQGVGAMGPGGALPSIVLPNGLPHAGNQQDLNYVMNLLNQLSEQVRQNREQTEHIVEGVRRIHHRDQTAAPQNQSGVEVNGEPEGDSASPRQESQQDLLARIADLEYQLSTVTQERDAAVASAASWEVLNRHYEGVQSWVNDKVRDYTYQCQQAMFSWHRHYLDLLQKEKDANLAMRKEHSQWQEGLGRVLDYNREVLKARTEEVEPYETERAELRVQNRCYRRLLGLSVAESDDEEDELRMQA